MNGSANNDHGTPVQVAKSPTIELCGLPGRIVCAAFKRIHKWTARRTAHIKKWPKKNQTVTNQKSEANHKIKRKKSEVNRFHFFLSVHFVVAFLFTYLFAETSIIPLANRKTGCTQVQWEAATNRAAKRNSFECGVTITTNWWQTGSEQNVTISFSRSSILLNECKKSK